MALSYASRTGTAPQLLVEAGRFEHRGGWSLDSQFLEQMGASYLIAHGLGKPVEDAQTPVRFPSPGRYHVWVRTKNWAPGPWPAPGCFQVAIHGQVLETIFGTEPGWTWQSGGSVEINDLDVVISLKDLSGFDGRCDALYFSIDPNDLPPHELAAMRVWRDDLFKSQSQHRSLKFDLVVVGGGIAGCAAALAASSQGLRVALAHERPVPGGNASGEVRVHTEGIHGAGGKILKGLDTAHWPNGSPDALLDDRKRIQTLAEAIGLEQFLGWRVTGLSQDSPGGPIRSLEALNLDTRDTLELKAPYFIDCSGDGWLGYWAGAEYRQGRESREEFAEGWDKHGELWSPQEPDGITMGSSVLWYSEEGPERFEFPAPPWALDVAGPIAAVKGEWFWEYGEGDPIADAESIRDHLLRAIYGSFANAKTKAVNAHRSLAWVSLIAGRRESRRLMGDYIYSMKDMTEARRFEDEVVEETRAIDVHHSRRFKGGPDFLSTALFHDVPKYYIPFRCLYSKDIPNLLMAGRCFSCTHIGLGGPRVMATTGQMGIATGYAAALCLRYGLTPRQLGKEKMPELKALIEANREDESGTGGRGPA